MRFEHYPQAKTKIYSQLSREEEIIIARSAMRYQHAAQTGRIALTASAEKKLGLIVQSVQLNPTKPIYEVKGDIESFQLMIAALQAEMPNLDRDNTYLAAHMVIDMRDACIESETRQFALTIPNHLPDMPDLNS